MFAALQSAQAQTDPSWLHLGGTGSKLKIPGNCPTLLCPDRASWGLSVALSALAIGSLLSMYFRWTCHLSG